MYRLLNGQRSLANYNKLYCVKVPVIIIYTYGLIYYYRNEKCTHNITRVNYRPVKMDLVSRL